MDSITPLTPTTLGPLVHSTEASWDNVRQFVDAAKKFARCQLACQVMAGFQLNELHKRHFVLSGRRLSSRIVREESHNQQIGNALAKPESWSSIVQAEAGISEDTASRWMKMAEAVRPRLKKLGSPDLREIIELPVSQITPEQNEILEKAVHKVTDGYTQIDFLEWLGIAKKPQGSGAIGGYKGRRPEPTIEEQIALARQAALDDWAKISEAITYGYATRFNVLEDWQIDQQIADLEHAIKTRRKWLALTRRERDGREFAEQYQHDLRK